jgi:hypothetical protein
MSSCIISILSVLTDKKVISSYFTQSYLCSVLPTQYLPVLSHLILGLVSIHFISNAVFDIFIVEVHLSLTNTVKLVNK